MDILIIGYGDVGKAISNVIGDKFNVYTLDINQEVECKPDVIHITFGYSDNYVDLVNSYLNKYNPKFAIIHSSVLPGTTEEIEKIFPNVAYSPCRGQHNSLEYDFKRMTKFVASNSVLDKAIIHLNECGFKTESVDDVTSLELVKLLDTTQYGILIGWAQEAERFCSLYGTNVSLVNKFASEIDEFYPGIRASKITPGFCGGKCVRQNIALLSKIKKSKFFDAFTDSNEKKNKSSVCR